MPIKLVVTLNTYFHENQVDKLKYAIESFKGVAHVRDYAEHTPPYGHDKKSPKEDNHENPPK